MNRLWIYCGAAVILIGLMGYDVSAGWLPYQERNQPLPGREWNFWGNTGWYQQQGESTSMSAGRKGPDCFGGDYSNTYRTPFLGVLFTSFYVNGTQIADLSGVWRTDLLGNLTIRLTGDEIIRASYKINNTNGYMQGNFSSNGSPVMDGFWWESPEYQPPYQAGAVHITFENSTALNGIFSYADGTWGHFTGTKIRANLTQTEHNNLMIMPKLNWTIDINQISDMRVTNQVDTNPIQIP